MTYIRTNVPGDPVGRVMNRMWREESFRENSENNSGRFGRVVADFSWESLVFLWKKLIQNVLYLLSSEN